MIFDMPCSVAHRKMKWLSFLGVATSAGSKCHDRQEAGCWNLNIPMERASIRKKAGESVLKAVPYFLKWILESLYQRRWPY